MTLSDEAKGEKARRITAGVWTENSHGELTKFLTQADWTGMVETELFAQTYNSYGLKVTSMEPFGNGAISRYASCGRANRGNC